jgi:uncharacterized protein (DUF1499 family)
VAIEREGGWPLRLGKSVVLTITIVLAGFAVAALGLRLYLGRASEGNLRPDEVINFASRNSSGRDNVFAMCPPRFCTPEADRESPIFELPWERLRDYWREVIAAQQSIEQVAADAEQRRFTYIQRSPVLRFPDIVTVEFVALGDDKSSLAIDSRSRYGKGDLGVNRRRVMDWMDLLQQMVRRRSAASAGHARAGHSGA